MTPNKALAHKRKTFPQLLRRDAMLLAIVALPILIIFVYRYIPMAGLAMAFQEIPRRGNFFSIFTNEWIGFQHFIRFFESPQFWRLIKNTFMLSLFGILWSFPVPILFALMLNEIRAKKYQRILQTIAYMPYFISLVVAMGIVLSFLSPQGGLFNQIRGFFGLSSVDFIGQEKYFRTIYIASGVWQGFGYSAIIYIAAITTIDQEIYEAATIDGASRFQQARLITLPCMMPTIVIMLILAMGNLLNVGYEKVLLLYTPATYAVSDVISTYVYRSGLGSTTPQLGFATAVGLFNSLINFAFILVVNRIARALSGISLW